MLCNKLQFVEVQIWGERLIFLIQMTSPGQFFYRLEKNCLHKSKEKWTFEIK